MEISCINCKNIFIEKWYFAHIDYTFYKKQNLDKKCSYNDFEQDIYSIRNEDNILLLG